MKLFSKLNQQIFCIPRPPSHHLQVVYQLPESFYGGNAYICVQKYYIPLQHSLCQLFGLYFNMYSHVSLNDEDTFCCQMILLLWDRRVNFHKSRCGLTYYTHRPCDNSLYCSVATSLNSLLLYKITQDEIKHERK